MESSSSIKVELVRGIFLVLASAITIYPFIDVDMYDLKSWYRKQVSKIGRSGAGCLVPFFIRTAIDRDIFYAQIPLIKHLEMIG